MTAETLITNAMATTTSAVNTAYTKLSKALTAYALSEAVREYNANIGKSPISSINAPRQFSFGSDIGSLALAIGQQVAVGDEEVPSIWDYTTDEGSGALSEELRELSLEARANIQAIKADFLAKAQSLLQTVTGAGDLDADIQGIVALQHTFIDQTFETFNREYAAAKHEEMRERRKLLDGLAAAGHTYLPGHAVDALNEQRLATTGKLVDVVRATYRERAQNKLTEFEARTNALLSVLGDLTDARIRVLLAAKQYAVSIAKGVEFAIDQTYYEKLRSMQYYDLTLKGFREDTKIKTDLIGAFNNVLQVQSRMDNVIREYKDYTLGKIKEDAEDDSLDAYQKAQEATVKSGLEALQWLGKIAAAAEAAANVVVSSSVTAFE